LDWHPYGQLASCYVCFVLSLYSGVTQDATLYGGILMCFRSSR